MGSTRIKKNGAKLLCSEGEFVAEKNLVSESVCANITTSYISASAYLPTIG